MTEDTMAMGPEQPEAAPSAGSVLSAAREDQGLSLEDVARSLKLAVRQVEALEQGEYARLPGITFVRGFIRNYARLLEIDPEPLLDTLHEAAAAAPAPAICTPSQRIELSVGKKRTWLWIVLLVLAVLIAAPLLLYEALRGDHLLVAPLVKSDSPAPLAPAPPRLQPLSLAPVAPPATQPPTEKPPASALVPQPAAEPQPSSQKKAAAGPAIEMTFSEDAWAEVRDKHGKVILAQISPAGSKQVVRGEPPFSLVIGKAPGVSLSYKGKTIDLAPYTKGDVARLTLE